MCVCVIAEMGVMCAMLLRCIIFYVGMVVMIVVMAMMVVVMILTDGEGDGWGAFVSDRKYSLPTRVCMHTLIRHSSRYTSIATLCVCE